MHFYLAVTTLVHAKVLTRGRVYAFYVMELTRVTDWIGRVGLAVTQLFHESIIVRVKLIDYSSFLRRTRLLSFAHWNVYWISWLFWMVFLLDVFVLHYLIQAKHVFRCPLSCFMLLWL